MARWRADGVVEFLGRADHQVKIRGFRIELGKIEAVLEQHPSVHEAVVLAQEITTGDKRLVAYVVSSTTGELDTNELRRFVQAKLPEYMVPSAIISLEALPVTPNGKVDREALHLPDDISFVRENTYLAPRDTVEYKLVQIWEQLLGVSSIGVQDSFFTLGGHSLLAVRLMAQIRQQFGQDLPLASCSANRQSSDWRHDYAVGSLSSKRPLWWKFSQTEPSVRSSACIQRVVVFCPIWIWLKN